MLGQCVDSLMHTRDGVPLSLPFQQEENPQAPAPQARSARMSSHHRLACDPSDDDQTLHAAPVRDMDGLTIVG